MVKEWQVDRAYMRPRMKGGDLMDSATYGRLFCYDWYRNTIDERILAKHYGERFPRPARTYRAARRNRQHNYENRMRREMGMKPHDGPRPQQNLH